MTPQEAIYELAEICLVRCDGEPSEDCLDCEINMAMEALEKTRWIPCSERLPEMFCTVLITAKLPKDKESLVYEGARIGKRWELAGVANPEDYIVSAWQPLPEPWEGA